jgi:hypothetical protein
MAVLVGLLAACGDSDGDDAGTPSECTRFVLFDHPEWEFHEAVDYPDDLGESAAAYGPHLDWYSEFERLVPAPDGESVESTSLRIAGQTAGLAEFGDSLPGTDLTERQGPKGAELVSAGAEGEPSVLAQSITDDYTLELLSYGLDLDELTEVAAATRPACEQEWLDAGGQILDCMPTEPGCVVPE